MSNTVTSEEIRIREYVEKEWPKFQVGSGIKLSKLFPEPTNTGLKHIWKHGHADISVSFKGKLICLIEPGGGQHFEEHQHLNDKRKWKLAEINGVRCLHLMNGVVEDLSKRQIRKVLGGLIYGKGKS